MTGIDGIWPDDPRDRVRIVVESIRSPVRTEYVAEQAEVSEAAARRELRTLASKGWVEETGNNEWRVVTDALDEDGLFPDGTSE